MKRRLLAVLLVIMLLAALMPTAAFASSDSSYVSVNGKAFESAGQTVQCGKGTAKLSSNGDSVVLELNNASITKFEKIGSFDGVNYYAGIVYDGILPLVIKVSGDTVIEAPSHGSNAYYEGIWASGGVDICDSAKSLTVNGVDCGIEADSNVVNVCTKNTVINAYDCGIVCSELYAPKYLEIKSTGAAAIVADTVKLTGTASISMTPNVKNGYSYCSAISANEVLLGDADKNTGSSVRINVSYDGSGYNGDDVISVCGMAVSSLSGVQSDITVSMNVTGSENCGFLGVVAVNSACNNSVTLNSTLNIKGQHASSSAVILDKCVMPSETTAVINGASADDIALQIGSLEQQSSSYIYAYTDCKTPNMGAFYCEGSVSRIDFTAKNMLYPAGGGFSSLTGDENNIIAVNADGTPSNVLLLSDKDYPFVDIDGASTAPYKDAIIWAVEKGITSGFTLTEFRPAQDCTRGQVVTFLWRAKGCPEPKTTVNPFVDVQETSPFYKAILWAYENGITKGFDETHFCPSNPCTRGQVVTFLWRSEGEPAPASMNNPFVDVKTTSPYYTAILWAAEKGITNGYGNNDFRPNVTCNRGQIVTFIYRDMK